MKVKSVAIDQAEPLWTVNFKRALAAQLQLQLDGSSGVFHQAENKAYNAENTAYHTMEVNSPPKTFYQIKNPTLDELQSNRANNEVHHDISSKLLNSPLGFNSTFFFVKQGSSHGECKTWYHIGRVPIEEIHANADLLPRPELCQGNAIYEIIKTRNLDECHSYPVFHYRSTAGLKCDAANGAGCENMMAVRIDSIIHRLNLRKIYSIKNRINYF